MAEAALFGFDEWQGKVEGPITRFHHNFNLPEKSGTWKMVKTEVLSSPEAREVEFRYENEDREGSHLRVAMAECHSISDAHEFIYSALRNIMHPNPPLDRPAGLDFGDIYKFGYWARDNIYVYLHDLSDPPLAEKEKKAFNEFIDDELKREPETASEDEAARPIIDEFSATPETVRVGASAQLKIKVRQPGLQYKIFSRGGRIYWEKDHYYYAAENEGKHRLRLYVTSSDGLTTMSELSLTVTQ